MHVSTDVQSERRTDLDWLRIGAFALLILFHVGTFYAPVDWEVKSPRIVPWMEVALEWSAPWRLVLLFMISGAATQFMCRRLAPKELFAARSLYLLPPLFFALLVVSPPQLYLKVVEHFDYAGGFWQFLPHYFGAGRPFCSQGSCLFMPNWEHLWFVAYLWIYTSLLALGFAIVGKPSAASGIALQRALRGWRLLLLPALYLAMLHIGLGHFFPETHGLVDDWYMHAVYVSAFLFGFLVLAGRTTLMTGFERLRWSALGIAIVAYALRAAYTWHYRGNVPIPIGIKVPMSFIYGFDQWAWIVAALGFANRHLRDRDGPVRRYLTEAIFPYYIIHQPIIIVVGHELVRLRLPLALEAFLLVTVCIAGCALTFELVRRVEWLRPWFGLKPLARRQPAPFTTRQPS